MNMKTALFLLIAGFATLFLIASSASGSEEEGAALYKARCAMCHGDDGKGDTRAGQMVDTPDLVAERPWKHGESLEEVAKVIRDGAGKMPGAKGRLTEDQITAVARYTLRFLETENE
jgi:mono/diheme cytochrome c family protein